MIDKNTLRSELFKITVGTLALLALDDFMGGMGLENSESTG